MTNSSLKVGVVRFPGSNCEQDAYLPLKHDFNLNVTYLWHQDADLKNVDAIIVPGGFSYGDYLRAGALASISPIMQSIKAFASQGRPVIGICNGFQILTEAGLLPGALQANRQCEFICDTVKLTVESTNTPFTQHYSKGQTIELPIAHAEGHYTADADTLKQLEDNHQIIFKYTSDINGSVNQIAGICNTQRNVVGMMPHPERALQASAINTEDGRSVFTGLIAHCAIRLAAV